MLVYKLFYTKNMFIDGKNTFRKKLTKNNKKIKQKVFLLFLVSLKPDLPSFFQNLLLLI